jgi:hypothetical protein
MIAAYSVRKLAEARKTSTLLQSKLWRVRVHELNSAIPNLLTRHAFWDHFDLGGSEIAELRVLEICNQIIHSYIFVLSAPQDEVGMDGVFVSSDRARKSRLYFIDLDTLIQIFEYIGTEDIVHFSMGKIGEDAFLETRISQHDLVESGSARYLDEDRIEISDYDRDALEALIKKSHDAMARQG